MSPMWQVWCKPLRGSVLPPLTDIHTYTDFVLTRFFPFVLHEHIRSFTKGVLWELLSPSWITSLPGFSQSLHVWSRIIMHPRLYSKWTHTCVQSRGYHEAKFLRLLNFAFLCKYQYPHHLRYAKNEHFAHRVKIAFYYFNVFSNTCTSINNIH